MTHPKTHAMSERTHHPHSDFAASRTARRNINLTL